MSQLSVDKKSAEKFRGTDQKIICINFTYFASNYVKYPYLCKIVFPVEDQKIICIYCTLFTLSLNHLILNELSVNEKNLNLILSIE